MTTDQDIARVTRQLAETKQALKDAERQIAKDRRMEDPHQMPGGLFEEFQAVQREADRAYQASGLVMPYPSSSETPDLFRARLAAKLLPHAGLSRADAAELYRNDNTSSASRIFNAAIEAAHHSPTLREVKTIDRSGREILEYYGQKNSWMGAFKRPALEGAIRVNDVPQRLPLIG